MEQQGSSNEVNNLSRSMKLFEKKSFKISEPLFSFILFQLPHLVQSLAMH